MATFDAGALQRRDDIKPLAAVPDAEDLELHRTNACPKLVTRRLRELVPLLEFVDCTVEQITSDGTVLTLPLLVSAMNQNGTHQAAIFYLVADYALGVAMFGVLPGVYVTGVHDRCAALPVQYWLKRGEVRHLAPGTGPLRVEVRIAAADASALRSALIAKGRAELKGIARIHQNGTLVAEAHHTMGIYADVPRAPGSRASIFQIQNLKVSALMVAGLRDDAMSPRVAQDQGRAIAQRMALVAPQLPALVRARTSHLERLLTETGRQFTQIVVLAVGLDPKPYLFSQLGARWFGVDLREMLKEREQRFAQFGSAPTMFTAVAADLRNDGWDAALIAAGYDRGAPTLFIVEGLSMYLSREEFLSLLKTIHGLNDSPESRLWVDHVTQTLFELPQETVRTFLASMARLGEPFVLGFSDIASLGATAWRCVAQADAARFAGNGDSVHNEYLFSVLARA
jgi:methyltransferase (TIGR00027 family)